MYQTRSSLLVIVGSKTVAAQDTVANTGLWCLRLFIKSQQEPHAYDFGIGAGFYLNATTDKYKTHYNMPLNSSNLM